MAKRFALLLISLLVLGFAVAGCGDDDDSSDSSGGGDSSSQESTKEDSGGGDAAPGLDSDAAKQAAEQCKTSIGAQTQLSDDVKKDLEEICEEAAGGDEDAVRKATKEVCVKIIEDTVPAGPARDTAVQSCDQATEAP